MNDVRKTPWKREAPFRLGDLEVLPASGELRGRRGVERLRPLLMDILLRLAAEPGEVVRRETLLEDVWPRRMVNDEVLSRAIAELRTALGDDARVARYIETLPKIGYRLVARVEPIAPPPAEQLPAPRARPLAWRGLAAGAVAAVLAAAAFLWLPRPAPADPFNRIESLLVTARPFTSDPGLEVTPRFSPDGSRVAFALVTGDESRIVVQAVDGSTRQFVGALEGVLRLSPVFFPDGRRIAYWQRRQEDCAIVEHDLETGLEQTLLDCKLSPRPIFDLSADGRWLVFSGHPRAQFPASLLVMEVAGGTPTVLTAPEPGMGEDVLPRFSPDGSKVAFYRGSASHRQAWIAARADGASARRLGRSEGLAYGIAWLGRDGPLLAAADWFGFRALNLVDASSGEARLVGARGARFPDVGPHGEIVYENATYACNLWPVEAGGGAGDKPLWSSTRYTSQADFSPDGARVAFVSNRDGIDAIYVATPSGEPKRVAFDEAYRFLRPQWSPDGRWIYAVRLTRTTTGVQEGVRIAPEGGRIEVLASLGQKVNDLSEGSDGNIYWGETAGNAMRLMRAPRADLARVERLPFPLVTQYQLNSGRLVYSQPQLNGLTACRIDTLSCEPLGLDIAASDLFHWTLAARAVYLRVSHGERGRLARFDLARRAITRTWEIEPSGVGSSIAVAPDESRMLVAREEGPTVDLMFAR
jgi:Tol biopolymer transport system component/DNA-binding winged helix-turn-helix (wHTH) protein